MPPPASMKAGRPVDREALAFLARFARLAYETRASVDASLKLHDGVEGWRFIDRDDTQAIIVEFDTFQILAFRGTEITSPKDILTDLKFGKTPMESGVGGKVHRGFRAATTAAIEDIRAELAVMPTYITGHSLGGALAVITAALLAGPFGLIPNCIVGVVTFGAPRVGDRAFIKGLAEFAGGSVDPRHEYGRHCALAPALVAPLQTRRIACSSNGQWSVPH